MAKDKKSEEPKENKEKKKFTKKQESERREAWLRIPIAIVSGFILEIWGFFVLIFSLVQLIMVLVEGKKNKDFLDMCKVYVAQLYIFAKYITFISNERPFPFGEVKNFKE
jgi:uncharacterized protein YqhQ